MILDNLIFSLNATIPIFLVMVLGWLLKQRKMLTDEFVRVANKFNFNVTLPCLLLEDMKNCGIKENFNGVYVLYCFLSTLICILVLWFLGRVFIKDKSIVGEFVQGSYRGSAAVLGIALIQNISGDRGMGPIMIAGSVPLYNAFAVILLTFECRNGEKKSTGETFKKAVLGVCKNPMIISILAGLIMSYFELDFPLIIDKTVKSVASMTTPLALIIIGASFEGRKAIKMIKPTIAASFIKLVAQPLVFLPIGAALGFGSSEMIAALIMLGAPTTASAYIMAKNMGHEGVLSSSIIVMTTVLSAFTVTFWLFIMKTLGWI